MKSKWRLAVSLWPLAGVGFRFAVRGLLFLVAIGIFIAPSYSQLPDPKGIELKANGQQPTADSARFTLIKTIPLEAKDIQTDRLGNLYVVSKTNQLYKYNSEGKLLSTLNYKYLGNITLVDATNPMEIYLFYKELNLVVFLDNNLAYRGEMNLVNFGIGQAAAIARSYDNGLWAFDLADLQLKKMDKNGENLQMSGNVRQYITNTSSVNFIYDNNDRVFINDSTNGVLVFDVFGTFIKTIPIKGCKEINVINDELYYRLGPQIKKYQLKTFTTKTYSLPDSVGLIDLSIEQERLYLLKSSEVSIYSF